MYVVKLNLSTGGHRIEGLGGGGGRGRGRGLSYKKDGVPVGNFEKNPFEVLWAWPGILFKRYQDSVLWGVAWIFSNPEG